MPKLLRCVDFIESVTLSIVQVNLTLLSFKDGLQY